MKISAARKRTENRPHHNHFPLPAATQLEIKVGLSWRVVDVAQNSLVDCIKPVLRAPNNLQIYDYNFIIKSSIFIGLRQKLI